MSKIDEKKSSQITNIYISDSVINRSSIGDGKDDSKVESEEESAVSKSLDSVSKISFLKINFADYLSAWFSNYEPTDKNLHTKLALFMSLIFIGIEAPPR